MTGLASTPFRAFAGGSLTLPYRRLPLLIFVKSDEKHFQSSEIPLAFWLIFLYNEIKLWLLEAMAVGRAFCSPVR